MKTLIFMALESTVMAGRFGRASAMNAIYCHSYSDCHFIPFLSIILIYKVY